MRAIPALLTMMSIWKRPAGEVGGKWDWVVVMRLAASVGLLTSAWTGTARMLCVDESCAAREVASSVEEDEV